MKPSNSPGRHRRASLALGGVATVAAAAVLGMYLGTGHDKATSLAYSPLAVTAPAAPSARASASETAATPVGSEAAAATPVSSEASVTPASAVDFAAQPLASFEPPERPIRLPDFGSERPSRDVRQVGNWAFYTGDNREHAVVMIDKRQAKAYVFDPEGALVGAAPVLLGSAVGDDTFPGVGDKPIAQVQPHERTTPAGRFVAEIGFSSSAKEDVVWVDYDAAVSMHRVRPWVKSERRLQRLASRTPADNRISYGCINMPREFYEQVLSPTVHRWGAVVYVLPEVRTPAEVFGSYEIRNADVLAMFAHARK